MSKQLVAEVSMSLLSDFHIEIRGSQSNINCFFETKSLWPALEKTVHCKISSIYWKNWYFPWRNTVVLKTRNTFQRKAGHTGKVEINFSSEKSAEEDVRKVPEEFKYFWKMPTLTEIPDLVLLPPEAWGIVVNFFINHLWNFYKYNQSHNHGLSTDKDYCRWAAV